MNNFDRFVGGGIADLMAQYGNQPSALDFVQQNEPIIRMAGGGMPEDYFDETLNEDFGFTPYQNNQAAVPTAPAPIFQAQAAPTPPAGLAPTEFLAPMPFDPAEYLRNISGELPAPPAPSAGVSPTPGVQFTPERDLPPQQVQSTAAPAGIASLAPIQASVPAYSPAPSPIQASVPAYTPAPSPFGMSFDQTAGDELGPVTGADLGISAPAVPAPSSTQAPAASTTLGFGTDYYNGQRGTWVTQTSGGGEGGGQTEQVFVPDRFQGDFTTQYSTAGGYKPFEGTIDPKAFGWAFQKGSNWQFDTMGARKEANEAAASGPIIGNPETGEAYYANPTTVADPYAVTNEKGESSLDPRYGVKDVSGLVHGRTSYNPDKNHITYVSAFFDPKTGKQVGQSVSETVKQSRDVWGDALFSLAMGAMMGPLAGALGGGALGAAAAGALSGAGQASVAGGDPLKAALTGALGAGLGNVASGYINPAAAAAGQAVGGGTLGDIVSGATKGALTSGTGALVSGKSIGDALLSGALGGGVSTGVNALVGEAGLPSAISNPLASAATAAILGKDPTMAAINSLIGQVTKAGGESGASDTGDETARLASRYPGTTAGDTTLTGGTGGTDDLVEDEGGGEEDEGTGGSTTTTTNAVDALLRGQDTSVGSGEDLTGGVGGEDLDTLLSSGVLGVGTGADTGEQTGTTQDTTQQTQATEGGEAGTSGDIIDQLRAAGVDVDSEYADSSIGDLIKGEDDGGEEVTTIYDRFNYGDGDGTDTGDGDESGGEGAGDTEAGDGNLDEDFVVTDKGTIKSTYTGEEGYFDENGDFVPYTERPPYTSGGTGGTGGGTGGVSPTKPTTPTKPITKTATPKRPTPAQSGVDFLSLLALMEMMGGEKQQAAPQQQLMNLAGVRSVADIFGQQPTSPADLLRRRA